MTDPRLVASAWIWRIVFPPLCLFNAYMGALNWQDGEYAIVAYSVVAAAIAGASAARAWRPRP